MNTKNHLPHFTVSEIKYSCRDLEQKTIVGNVNLASNRDYNHGAIIRIYMVSEANHLDQVISF